MQPVNHEFSLERTLVSSELIQRKCKDPHYAQNLYAALCNTEWQYRDLAVILAGDTWGCSWRHAGAIVAEIRNATTDDATEDYMDWYCSGIPIQKGQNAPGSVEEGTVTDEIRQDLKELNWKLVKQHR